MREIALTHRLCFIGYFQIYLETSILPAFCNCNESKDNPAKVAQITSKPMRLNSRFFFQNAFLNDELTNEKEWYACEGIDYNRYDKKCSEIILKFVASSFEIFSEPKCNASINPTSTCNHSDK